MRTLHGWKGLSAVDKGASVALGNFDGVHLGHQAVIGDASDAAHKIATNLAIVSFEPHARKHFQPDSAPFRLMNLPQFSRVVRSMGVDVLYMLPFGAEMAGFSDFEFVLHVLVEGLAIRHVAVGFDITFGRGRSGDPDAMRRYGERFGFTVSVTPPCEAGGEKVSSTAIRDAIRMGRPERAAELLGRPFAIEGVVEKGRQLGRRFGFPTANVSLGDYVTPQFGVYATRTRLGGESGLLPGVASIGTNPTTGEVSARLEVHLLDFHENIYGETIETELIAYLRPEVRFCTVDALVEQMGRDRQVVRELLAHWP